MRSSRSRWYWLVAGSAALLVALPGAHALLDGPLLVAAHIAAVVAGLYLIGGAAYRD